MVIYRYEIRKVKFQWTCVLWVSILYEFKNPIKKRQFWLKVIVHRKINILYLFCYSKLLFKRILNIIASSSCINCWTSGLYTCFYVRTKCSKLYNMELYKVLYIGSYRKLQLTLSLRRTLDVCLRIKKGLQILSNEPGSIENTFLGHNPLPVLVAISFNANM